MFKIVVVNELYCGMENAHFERIFDLPFPPFIGLEVCDYVSEFEEPLVKVAYFVDKGYFYCQTETRIYHDLAAYNAGITRNLEHGYKRTK